MIIGEISLRDIPCLQPDSTLREAARLLRDAASGVAAVTEGGRLLGTVSERDLVVRGCAEGLDPGTARVADVYDATPPVCPNDVDLKYALHLMREHRQSWLVLADRTLKPVGAVSLVELLDLVEELLPEQSTGPEPEYVHRVRGDTLP